MRESDLSPETKRRLDDIRKRGVASGDLAFLFDVIIALDTTAQALETSLDVERAKVADLEDTLAIWRTAAEQLDRRLQDADKHVETLRWHNSKDDDGFGGKR
jgi:hypothetical protein